MAVDLGTGILLGGVAAGGYYAMSGGISGKSIRQRLIGGVRGGLGTVKSEIKTNYNEKMLRNLSRIFSHEKANEVFNNNTLDYLHSVVTANMGTPYPALGEKFANKLIRLEKNAVANPEYARNAFEFSRGINPETFSPSLLEEALSAPSSLKTFSIEEKILKMVSGDYVQGKPLNYKPGSKSHAFINFLEESHGKENIAEGLARINKRFFGAFGLDVGILDAAKGVMVDGKDAQFLFQSNYFDPVSINVEARLFDQSVTDLDIDLLTEVGDTIHNGRIYSTRGVLLGGAESPENAIALATRELDRGRPLPFVSAQEAKLRLMARLRNGGDFAVPFRKTQEKYIGQGYSSKEATIWAMTENGLDLSSRGEHLGRLGAKISEGGRIQTRTIAGFWELIPGLSRIEKNELNIKLGTTLGRHYAPAAGSALGTSVAKEGAFYFPWFPEEAELTRRDALTKSTTLHRGDARWSVLNGNRTIDDLGLTVPVDLLGEKKLSLPSYVIPEDRFRAVSQISGVSDIFAGYGVGDVKIVGKNTLNSIGVINTKEIDLAFGYSKGQPFEEAFLKDFDVFKGSSQLDNLGLSLARLAEIRGTKGAEVYQFLGDAQGQKVLGSFVSSGQTTSINTLLQTRGTTLGLDAKLAAHHTFQDRNDEIVRQNLKGLQIGWDSDTKRYVGGLTLDIHNRPIRLSQNFGPRGIIQEAVQRDIHRTVVTSELFDRLNVDVEKFNSDPNYRASVSQKMQKWIESNPSEFSHIVQGSRTVKMLETEALKEAGGTGLAEGVEFYAGQVAEVGSQGNVAQRNRARKLLESHGYEARVVTEDVLREQGISWKEIGKLKKHQNQYQTFWNRSLRSGEYFLPGTQLGLGKRADMIKAQQEFKAFSLSQGHKNARNLTRFREGKHGFYHSNVNAMPGSWATGAGGKGQGVGLEFLTGIQFRGGNETLEYVLKNAESGAMNEANELSRMFYGAFDSSRLPKGVKTFRLGESGIEKGEISSKTIQNYLRGGEYPISEGTFAIEKAGMKIYVPREIPNSSYIGTSVQNGKQVMKKANSLLSHIFQNIDKEGFKAKEIFLEETTKLAGASLNLKVKTGLVSYLRAKPGQAIIDTLMKQSPTFRNYLQTYAPELGSEDISNFVTFSHSKDIRQGMTAAESLEYGNVLRGLGGGIVPESPYSLALEVQSPAINPGKTMPSINISNQMALEMMKYDLGENSKEFKIFQRDIGNTIQPGSLNVSKFHEKWGQTDWDSDHKTFLRLFGEDAQQAKNFVLFNKEGTSLLPSYLAEQKAIEGLGHKSRKRLDIRQTQKAMRNSLGLEQSFAKLLSESTVQSRVSGELIGSFYNAFSPTIQTLRQRGGQSEFMAATLAENLEEHATILAGNKRGDLLEKAKGVANSATNLLEMLKRNRGNKSSIQDALSDLIQKTRMDKQFEAKGLVLNEYSDLLVDELINPSQENRHLANILEARKGYSASSLDAVLTAVTAKTQGGSPVSDALNSTEEVALKMGRIEIGSRQTGAGVENFINKFAKNPKARNALLIGAGAALAASWLFSPPSRMDLKEEELEAAAQEASRQGLIPEGSADFRSVNPARIGRESPLRARIGGVVQGSGANQAVSELNRMFNGASGSIRLKDSRMDITADNARRMAESGRSY